MANSVPCTQGFPRALTRKEFHSATWPPKRVSKSLTILPRMSSTHNSSPGQRGLEIELQLANIAVNAEQQEHVAIAGVAQVALVAGRRPFCTL